ncbi:MAG: short-chain dehydrogenase [Campylobacteraceae bacterium 4484_166]|nr:MAG: short-chain dehydrogenase [Campylobacteraceae bacterium 4484_166]
MKNAIITGYSSGIGKSIKDSLEKKGYNIIKLSSNFKDTQAVEKECKDILNSFDIDILINCAGIGCFEPLEEISVQNIKNMININLTAPIILSAICLRSLKKTKGHIINICSIEATRNSKFSAVYTATKSGLRNFSLSLFEECRKSGVKVTSINPDMTDTNFFNNLKFEPTSNKDEYIDVTTISDMVIDIINCKSTITDVTIRPQKFAINKKR